MKLSPENELWPVPCHSDNLILFLFTLTTKSWLSPVKQASLLAVLHMQEQFRQGTVDKQ